MALMVAVVRGSGMSAHAYSESPSGLGRMRWVSTADWAELLG